MHDKFEKEVQQQLEGQRLIPSAPVWEKIELEIREEKRKRRFFFWILFSGLVLIIGGWIAIQLMPQKLNQPLKTEESTFVKRENTAATTPLTAGADTQAVSPFHIRKKSKAAQQQVEAGKKAPAIALINQPLPANDKKIIRKAVTLAQSGVKTVLLKDSETSVTNQAVIDETSRPGRVRIEPISSSRFANGPQYFVIPVLVAEEHSYKSTIQKPEISVSPTNDSTAKKKVAVNRQWKGRILVEAGRSSYAEASLNKSLAVTYNSPLSGVTGGAAMPQSVSAGFGFAVGYALAKNLNPHWEFSVGLQYAQLSTTVAVGSRGSTDTTLRDNSSNFTRITADSYYQNGSARRYTNKFCMIEIPVSLSYKPSFKLPLVASIGVAYGRLISTNALTFSPSSNLLYQNKDNYVRNQVPLFSSVQAELRLKKKVSLRTGPFVQYNLLQLQKNNPDGTPHLVFAGLQTAVCF